MVDEDGILDPVTYVIPLDGVQESALENNTVLAKGARIAGRPGTRRRLLCRPGFNAILNTALVQEAIRDAVLK